MTSYNYHCSTRGLIGGGRGRDLIKKENWLDDLTEGDIIENMPWHDSYLFVKDDTYAVSITSYWVHQ